MDIVAVFVYCRNQKNVDDYLKSDSFLVLEEAIAYGQRGNFPAGQTGSGFMDAKRVLYPALISPEADWVSANFDLAKAWFTLAGAPLRWLENEVVDATERSIQPAQSQLVKPWYHYR